MSNRYDAIVVGAGPNGLAAAIELAKKGKRVCVHEANDVIGGGARSKELTLPGFIHDTCSAVHPLAVGSPFFKNLSLNDYGLEFVFPPAQLAHPFDDGSALLLHRSVEETSQQLGADARSYSRLLEPLVRDWQILAPELLGPIQLTHHPYAMTRFGLNAIRSAAGFVKSRFKEERTRAFFAGAVAHSCLSLDRLGTTAFGLVLLTLGHRVGWPIPRGGAQQISNALAAYFKQLGGEIMTSSRIESLADLPLSRCVLFDITPRQLVRIAGERFPKSFNAKLNAYRYGPAAFKLDWALDGPVPWRAAECTQAATVHLGGSLGEIEASEAAVWDGKVTDRPFVLAAQPSLFDPSRAPEGKHTLWAYCHVPNGSQIDMTEAIENQVERFAPGFRSRILARTATSPAQFESNNANLVGGDINGGAATITQLFTRPTARTYSTPLDGVYICSSSTPPGGGVHGMCGYHAAHTALRKSFSRVGE
ncbi:MAG: NAD(P)/FAD-dependent oxidoreductase [Acidobacteria bacterium]|nr:NAD(P)/FAD-dependent oxidoreductase [Acidobacteriota bacterium]